uniref:Reverse transcriptase Ty1/copia-type domain-containing protein n=1 Tax=Peronospora matthiolae TaxID=2874970 RepID=A0AAV1TKB8_9STRA
MQLIGEELARFDAQKSGDVCLRLIKSLYGLKQTSRLWNQLLHKTLADIGDEQSMNHSYVYFKTNNEGTVILGTYGDDLLAAATSDKLLDDFSTTMKSLELKCLGPAKHFLGMWISYIADAGAVRAPIADESSLQSESTSARSLPSTRSGSAEQPTVQ